MLYVVVVFSYGFSFRLNSM